MSVSSKEVTPAQVKAARGLLGWARDRLASRSGMPAQTLRYFENGVRISMTLETLAAIRAALEGAGVEFTDGAAPGVRLRAAEQRCATTATAGPATRPSALPRVPSR